MCYTRYPMLVMLALHIFGGQFAHHHHFPLNACLGQQASGQSAAAAQPDGDGDVQLSGEFKQWHKLTLTLDGPYADESAKELNPFTDLAMHVTFEHPAGQVQHIVPGYFAADGEAANSGATDGTRWRAHFRPDLVGEWKYRVTFLREKHVAAKVPQSVEGNGGSADELTPFSGKVGSFTIGDSDKPLPDLRARGRLEYVGQRYLRFAGSHDYFLKAGPDAPETLLAFTDFDNTIATNPDKGPLKTWQPHVKDWNAGDPTWKEDKGKGLIGAINYLSSKGMNTISFLPYNAGGDGDNVWPFIHRDDKLHYDCSKLDQWGIVFDHATHKGLHLHFKLQENEIDDNRRGHAMTDGVVPESLDGGRLGIERKIYCREMIARFGHALALNWNIGEENTQSAEEQRDMIAYLAAVDPYQHNIVIHTFPDQQARVYSRLLGDQSQLTGASLQNPWSVAHERCLEWIRESAETGRPWVVCNDEQNPASYGVPPDPGYQGHDGRAGKGDKIYTLHDIRQKCLWGTLMAGGAGVEYYFGYQLPENDLKCEDFRSRDASWDYCRFALEFFNKNHIPYWNMVCQDDLVDKPDHYCLAKNNEVYVIYLPPEGTAEIDLSQAAGDFSVSWFNPRRGGPLQAGSVEQVTAGGVSSLGAPPRDAAKDWVILLRK